MRVGIYSLRGARVAAALTILWQGMLGIFAVMALITLIVMLFTKFSK